MKKQLILFGLLLSVCFGVVAQPLASPVPFDPKTKMGKLPNGLTYYIRYNAEPKKRAELMLVNKVGAVLEEDNENGLAHFTEHMGFNGTKNFPKNELVSYLQRNGVKFGDDLNAYTSFDQTVYMLPIPTDTAALFEKGFAVLEDWAHNMLMEGSEIDKERGVILEELRGGKGAGQRMQDKFFPVIMNGAAYGKRNIIGTEEILKNFSHETIRNFYKKWYRPDLQAIIAVGDFNVDRVEAIIKERFGSIPAAGANAPVRSEVKIPPHNDMKVAIVTDKEQPNTIVQVLYKHPKLRENTLTDSRFLLARNLFNSMFSNRIQELTKKADPPFQFGGGGMGNFLGDIGIFSNFVVAKTGALERGLNAILDENARAAKFGFAATELERAKTQFLTSMEKRFKEKDKTKSNIYANEYVSHFLSGASAMGIETYLEFVKTQLPTITLEEINDFPKKFITQDNTAVIVMAPEKDKEKLPTEAQIKEIFANAGKNVTAYVDEVITKPLLATAPTAGKVTTEKALPEVGVTELTLSNGMKVVLKPTDFKNDEILFSSYSFGGTSLYNEADFRNADYSNALAAQGGVAEFSALQLKKYLTGKVVNVGAYVGELTEGMNGSFSPKDAETGLQLIYANFTQPRKDEAVVKGFLANAKDGLNQKYATPDPESVFFDTLSSVLGGYHPRRMPEKPSDIDQVNLDRSLAIYKERFADASDFTFFFVGNFKVDEMKPLLEKYLGSLPSTRSKEKYKDLNIKPLKGKVSKTIYQGIDDKAMAQLVYSGDFSYTPQNIVNLEAIEEVLNIKLIEEIREKESGVYYIYAQGKPSKLPTPRYELAIGYGTNPGRVEELATKTLAILENIRKNGPDPKDIEKFKIETKRDLEVKMKENRFWLNELSSSYQNGENPKEILDAVKLVDSVTVASAKAAAMKLMGNNFTKLVLLPAKK